MWDEVLLCIGDLGTPLNLFKMGTISQNCGEDASKCVGALRRHTQRQAFIVSAGFGFGARPLCVSAALFWSH